MRNVHEIGNRICGICVHQFVQIKTHTTTLLMKNHSNHFQITLINILYPSLDAWLPKDSITSTVKAKNMAPMDSK